MINRIITFSCLLSLLIYNTSQAQSGYLKLNCNGLNNKIVVDDTLYLSSITQPVQLDTGWHHISVLNPRRGTWNNDGWDTQVQISTDDTTTITPRFSIPLSIQTIPFDAQVFLNEKMLGTTPLHIQVPPLTSATLHFKKKHYLPVSIPIDSINSGTINIMLPPNRKEQSLFQQAVEQDRQKYRRHKLTTYSLMAVTLCSGFATAYLNEQAEREYEKYMQSANIPQMNTHYKNTQKYDQYAAISLGMFEVSFAFSFYYLVKTVVR